MKFANAYGVIMAGAVAMLASACSPVDEEIEPVVKELAVSSQVVEKIQKPELDQPVEAATAKVEPKHEVHAVTIDQLYAMLASDAVYLVDARPSFVYRLGHINGSVNRSVRSLKRHRDAWMAEISQANKEGKQIVIYCLNENCPDAHRFASEVTAAGVPCSVYVNGWEEWKSAGL
ncbi:rhodanese-like domain-containing protein [Persicirhabdus sediminis]|uniref:Rhodanese-like domain-containing protein n=1 Tax=Persicirhabdus sediminis TaxID=454144 RepID=A0A8J7SLX0_9BACT|nr:rhodanese-like domain-containing protein [Persicirhabdus sediminis]MBK1792611.1 rhodanese-like domain-containing protein [Persicirhabdus sediminis]